jgi:alpha,alpha-trehalose phosphorylase
VYELRPLPYAEAGYGYPESGQTVINITNGKLIRLLVDDEPFDVRYGTLRAHERVLDFRDGVLRRTAEWASPAHQAIRVQSTRLVSFTHRSIAAFCYEVTPLDATAQVTVQSELITNEELPAADGDPRATAALDAPLQPEFHAHVGPAAELVHSTRQSGLHVAAGMLNEVEAPGEPQVVSDSHDDWGRVTITATLEAGQTLRLVKLVGYGWSAERSVPAVRDQVMAGLAAAHAHGWDRLVADQRSFLDAFWERADVEVEGDAEVQQAVRFALFHLVQSSARAERRAIPAKGLTGPGYDGHTFWDSESFVLPVLTYTAHESACDALYWRHETLPLAKDRAAQLGLQGAAFPWRTIHGEECSGYWPAGTAAFHIGADIAAAVGRAIATCSDAAFERDVGLELLVETARLWRSLGHFDLAGRFRIGGVTGPDEYSAIADNNVYTNLMAQQNLRLAAMVAGRHADREADLGFDADEVASWSAAADAMFVPYDDDLDVHQQADGFTNHEVWDFEGTPPEKYPLLLHFPYFDLYRKQVVKQADLVLALYLRGDAFTAEEKRRDFDYYEPLTVRDSSLSACVQSVMAAEVGYLALAHDYLRDAALMDLDDLEHNTRDGLHMASLAGTWIALVAGFGGMRDHDGVLRFRPRLPDGLTRLAFALETCGNRVRVELAEGQASYQLVIGDELVVLHEDESLTLRPGDAVSRPLAPGNDDEPPAPPAGREPAARWKSGA